MADIEFSFFSQQMGRHVHMTAIVPFDIADQFGFKKPFKSLYFLPGYSANASAILSGTLLAEEVSYRGFAVFIPDGENSFYMDQAAIGANYEKYVTEELIRVTRELFPISDKREDTYIGGISMGGFGALMLGARHMDIFSKIIALSPATDAYGMIEKNIGFTREQIDYYFKGEDNYYKNFHPIQVLRAAKKKGKEIPPIFLCCGEQDPLTYDFDRTFAEQAQETGLSIETHWGDGAHETRYWNKLLPAAMDFMLQD